MKKKISLFIMLILILANISFAWVDAGYRPPISSPVYYISASFSSDWVSKIQSASSTWNNVGSGLHFQYAMYPDYRTQDFLDDIFHVTLVNFQSLGYPSTANAAFGRVSSGEYGDIIVNSLRNWGDGNSATYLDRQGILTHEFGHVAGLDDIKYSNQVATPSQYTYTTMYAYSDYSMLNSYGMRSLHSDDIEGINSIW